MLYQSQNNSRHHCLCNAHEISWGGKLTCHFVRTVTIAKPTTQSFSYLKNCDAIKCRLPRFFHNRSISAITSTSGLAKKHVKIMTMVVAFFETVRAQRHTRRYTTSATSVGHKIWSPY